MNQRLQQFLELEQLTPSRLADILGVQRSGLSHILSGRNNPGYDFIYKLLIKFPQINAEWLITGKGKPYKDLNKESELSLFPNIDKPLFNENQLRNEHIKEENDMTHLSENSMDQIFVSSGQQKRSVKRITLFYSDGSFEEFFMSNRL